MNRSIMNNQKQVVIRQVWADNFEEELRLICFAVHMDRFNIISVDTEFPGVIYAPKVNPALPYHLQQHMQPSEHYTYLKKNVNDLKLIQLGLTLSDADGNLPTNFGTNTSFIWEFNFSDFNPKRDPHHPVSVNLLRQQGINFELNLCKGVDSRVFAQRMKEYRLVYNHSVSWVTFHSAYDFGYLVKILTGRNLPEKLEQFLHDITLLFGKNVYDIKHLIKFCDNLYGGLERVATTLNVTRAVGNAHQAGSDSLLTLHTFKKMMNVFNNEKKLYKHAGVLFGLEIVV